MEKNEWLDNDHGQPSHAFALSQHHGLPTFLLDWTRNPNNAAFFAADSNRNSYLTSKKRPSLAVWAVNLEDINKQSRYVNALRILTCPRYEHGFLHKQDALFLWYPAANVFRVQKGKWPDFLEVINKSYSKNQRKPIRKITLKGEKVEDLLRKLYRLRISRAHLMPTYDNIAKTMEYGSFIESMSEMFY